MCLEIKNKTFKGFLQRKKEEKKTEDFRLWREGSQEIQTHLPLFALSCAKEKMKSQFFKLFRQAKLFLLQSKTCLQILEIKKEEKGPPRRGWLTTLASRRFGCRLRCLAAPEPCLCSWMKVKSFLHWHFIPAHQPWATAVSVGHPQTHWERLTVVLCIPRGIVPQEQRSLLSAFPLLLACAASAIHGALLSTKNKPPKMHNPLTSPEGKIAVSCLPGGFWLVEETALHCSWAFLGRGEQQPALLPSSHAVAPSRPWLSLAGWFCCLVEGIWAKRQHFAVGKGMAYTWEGVDFRSEGVERKNPQYHKGCSLGKEAGNVPVIVQAWKENRGQGEKTPDTTDGLRQLQGAPTFGSQLKSWAQSLWWTRVMQSRHHSSHSQALSTYHTCKLSSSAFLLPPPGLTWQPASTHCLSYEGLVVKQFQPHQFWFVGLAYSSHTLPSSSQHCHAAALSYTPS